MPKLIVATDDKNWYPLTITQTCKQIRSECGRLFFIHNTFVFEHDTYFDQEGMWLWTEMNKTGTGPLQMFVDTVGKENAAVVQDVLVKLSGCRFVSLPQDDYMQHILQETLHDLHGWAVRFKQWHLKVRIGAEKRPGGRKERLFVCEIKLNEAKRSTEEALAKVWREGDHKGLRPELAALYAEFLTSTMAEIEDERAAVPNYGALY